MKVFGGELARSHAHRFLAAATLTAMKNNSKSKIAFIAPFGLKAKGTAAARVLPIAEVLVERGYRVRVIIPPWDDPAGSPDLALQKTRREVANGVELAFVPVRPGPQPLLIPARLVQEALSFKPDLIHVFKPKAYSGLAALWLTLRHIPFVLDTDDWEGRGGYNEVNPYSPLQKRLFDWQERDLPGRAAAMTVASRTLEAQAWGFGVAPERVVYLPNGISPHKYAGWSGAEVEQAAQEQRHKLGLDGKLVLLAYTRFVEFKPERLLQIVRLILDRLPPEIVDKVRLLVVGGGFFGEEKGLSELATSYGLADKISTTGPVSLSDLSALLRCGDVALYPFDDNLINRARCSAKFLDLLMAERPVVTEAVGELREYLQDGQGGYSVRPDDNVAFAESAASLIEITSETRAAFGKQGSERLKRLYPWERLVEPLEQLYRQIKVG